MLLDGKRRRVHIREIVRNSGLSAPSLMRKGRVLKKQVSRLNLNATFDGIVSEDVKNAAYDWCDILVLSTLSENFGLVIAEALERGKCVITTDGVPAWGDDCECKMESVKCKIGEGEIRTGYGGRLTYLRGYRDGTLSDRIQFLKCAIENLCHS